MSKDFDFLRDAILVDIADNRYGNQSAFASVTESLNRVDPIAPQSWIKLVADDLVRLGYGEQRVGRSGEVEFRIMSSGLTRAAEIRREVAPKTFRQIITSDFAMKLATPVGVILTIISTLIALTALYISYLQFIRK